MLVMPRDSMVPRVVSLAAPINLKPQFPQPFLNSGSSTASRNVVENPPPLDPPGGAQVQQVGAANGTTGRAAVVSNWPRLGVRSAWRCSGLISWRC